MEPARIRHPHRGAGTKLLSLPIHPIFWGISPILYLYARNAMFIPFVDTLRSLAFSVGLVVLFLCGFRLILRGWEKAGVLSSLLTILFYSFGHVANSLERWSHTQGLEFDVAILAGIWLFAFFVLSLIIVRSRMPGQIAQFLNMTSAIFVIFPLVSIISTLAITSGDNRSETAVLSKVRGEAQAEPSILEVPRSELPDIYYIVLDGYSRSDILDEFYDYNNSSFIEGLEQRGFFVASSSRSNFLNTTYSLNTSLNLMYFSDFPSRIARTARYNLRTNYANDFLREQGYQVVVFDSGTGDTNNQYADVFISPPSSRAEGKPQINAFEQLLVRTTMGLPLLNVDSQPDDPELSSNVVTAAVDRELSERRERINHAFAHLPDYASKQGAYFLFAHVYLPHEPFLYGPGGEELKYRRETNLYWYEFPPEDYVEFYAYQVDYINQKVLHTIDAILAESDNPVVIVLQADHGDGHYLDWNVPTTDGVDIRSAILNAIYFSDRSYQNLYPTVTPVNTFRIVFNHWFGTQFPLLPDRVFFHEHPVMTPFNETPEFIDACVRFGICLPSPGS